MNLESKLTKSKEKSEMEQIVLIGKDDVFNSEPYNKSMLEHEML